MTITIPTWLVWAFGIGSGGLGLIVLGYVVVLAWVGWQVCKSFAKR